MADERIDVTNATERSRYELTIGGRLVGVLDYRVTGDTVVLPHTEIVPASRGRGLGALLVQGALDDIRGTGRHVVPACWYVAQYIGEHPEYGELVASAR
jgi:predicted GNAT family acetyltransferase